MQSRRVAVAAASIAAAALAAAAAAFYLSRRARAARAARAPPIVLLIDNGSLRAESFESLRAISARVGALLGLDARAASARFADRIVLADGSRGATLATAARAALDADARASLLLLPAFLGASDTLYELVEAEAAALRAAFPAARIAVARAALDARVGAAALAASAAALAGAVARAAREAAAAAGFAPGAAALAVCEHGSPTRAVGDARAAVVRALGGGGGEWRALEGCAMERRAGAEYDFNDPLLEVLLRKPPFDAGDVVLGMLFFSPGKHAGAGGDIDGIVASAVADARAAGRELRVAKAALLGAAPELAEVLAQRAREALPKLLGQ
jgi:hypothetical protein